jgi:hypothetical protein
VGKRERARADDKRVSDGPTSTDSTSTDSTDLSQLCCTRPQCRITRQECSQDLLQCVGVEGRGETSAGLLELLQHTSAIGASTIDTIRSVRRPWVLSTLRIPACTTTTNSTTNSVCIELHEADTSCLYQYYPLLPLPIRYQYYLYHCYLISCYQYYLYHCYLISCCWMSSGRVGSSTNGKISFMRCWQNISNTTHPRLNMSKAGVAGIMTAASLATVEVAC